MPNMVLFNIFINYLELIKFAGDIKVGKTAKRSKAWKKYKTSFQDSQTCSTKGIVMTIQFVILCNKGHNTARFN